MNAHQQEKFSGWFAPLALVPPTDCKTVAIAAWEAALRVNAHAAVEELARLGADYLKTGNIEMAARAFSAILAKLSGGAA